MPTLRLPIEIYILDTVVRKDDDWDEIILYEVQDINKNECTISPKRTSDKKEEKEFVIESSTLLIYPFSLLMRDRYKKQALSMELVADLICAELDRKQKISLHDISAFIMKHKTKYEIEDETIADWILRCLTAAGLIIVRKAGNTFYFSLSPSRISREKERKFSATIASELTSLSERIRTIISHGSTVGTYREKILQHSLQKHLPERYHVGTGFVYGLDKQIDILVYDRIDYAPMFRENDLVIVPPESVRAIIEVKTNLNSQTLDSALTLLSLASQLDDNRPPFFKGIFAFESSLQADAIYKRISNFYTDLNTMSKGGPGDIICQPFRHLTCACVANTALAYIEYSRNKKNRLVPILRAKSSATELDSQTSLFMQSLLSYLKFGGAKPFKINYIGRMLGEDTLIKEIKDLREDDDSWGAYFLFDDEGADNQVVTDMENLIISVQNWLNGDENFETGFLN